MSLRHTARWIEVDPATGDSDIKRQLLYQIKKERKKLRHEYRRAGLWTRDMNRDLKATERELVQ